MQKVVLFGDSLTQFGQGPSRAMNNGGPGWADRLVEYYARRVDVINRGCFGYNTRDALNVGLVPSDLDGDMVLFATVLFGSNDACSAEYETNGKHVVLDEYKQNLEEILSRVSKFTKRILFICPPRIHEARYAEYRLNVVKKPVDRSNELLLPYVKACWEVAQTHNLPCINLFDELCGDEMLRDDGLHFSELGDAKMFALVKHKFETIWPEIAVVPDAITHNYSNSASSCSLIKPLLPFWDKLDGTTTTGQAENETSVSCHITKRPSICLVGDSITQQCQGMQSWCNGTTGAGWGDMLQAYYSRRLDIYNRGYSGYNSKWILQHSDKIFASFPFERVELCTLFLGANDATACGPQHVALEEYKANMDALILLCLRRAKRLVVIGPPPICHSKYLAWRRNRKENVGKLDEELLDRTYLLAKQYSLAVQSLAAVHQVPFIDMFQVLGSDFAASLSDGLHLNGQGNALLGSALLACIAKQWPEMACTSQPDYGYYGTMCEAFPPEQPWFQDLHEENAKRESKRMKSMI